VTKLGVAVCSQKLEIFGDVNGYSPALTAGVAAVAHFAFEVFEIIGSKVCIKHMSFQILVFLREK
jgi:hypothetical protein